MKGRDETIREMREKGFCEWAKEKGFEGGSFQGCKGKDEGGRKG